METTMDLRSIIGTAFLTVTLIGCGGGAPTPGTWSYADYEPTSNNTCTGELVNASNGTFTLVEDGADYIVEPGDGGNAFACTLDGDELTCTRSMSIAVAGSNAVIHGEETAIASTTADSMEGTRSASVTCEGSDCAMASEVGLTFPCELEIDFTAELQ
jgi:hypothetical protein